MSYSAYAYQSTAGYRGKPPGLFDGTPVVKYLVIANVAIFLLGIMMATGHYLDTVLYTYGAFNIQETWFGGQLWRVLTFQFLHVNPGHLFMNMIGLYFFGRHIELWMGAKPFLIYYLLCGVAGVIFYTFIYYVPGLFDHYGPTTPMIGASAGVLGLLSVYMVKAPDQRVLLFFFIPMKVRTASILFFIYESLAVVFDFFGNGGGSAGHLGGALCGLFFMKNKAAQRWLLARGYPKVQRKSHRHGRPIREANIVPERRSPYQETQEVDRILDKISAEGFESLTREEKETLDRARRP